MRKLRLLLPLFCFVVTLKVSAQTNEVKVAVFAPLYINDAFSGNSYQLGKNSLPKNLLPGLEFYNGVMMAIDSLKERGISAEISVYDTKNSIEFNQVLQGNSLTGTGVIIAAFTNTAELKSLASVALQKNIPLISATYPNTGNMAGNPFFILLNSSLQAHLEGLYKYLQKTYSLENILFVRKAGAVENYIKNTFTDLNKNSKSSPLKMKWLDLTDTFYTAQITRYLDTTKRNVIVVASPNETFGAKVVRSINGAENYNTTLVGMPTWDAIRDLNRSSLKNVDIVYSTPFRYSPYDRISTSLTGKYKAKYNSRPSDMVFKGYETLFHFTSLLNKYGDKFMNNISDNDFTVFNQFDILPVKLKKGNKGPDYFENKRLYFVKKHAGEVVSVNNY